jgi:hypothetical protein
MKRSAKKQTEPKMQITVTADVEYSILPEMPEINLPAQVDVTGVFVDVKNEKTGKSRRTNILHSLDDSNLADIEAEIEWAYLNYGEY